MHYIYEITNNINGKNYVGKHSCNLTSKCKHVCRYFGGGTNLRRAIAKYGKDNFTKCIIKECESDATAYEFEVEYIKFYKVAGKAEYNIAVGGVGGQTGYTHTDETRARMSAKLKGRIITEEQKANLRARFIGRPLSDETKAKMRMALVGKRWSESRKAQLPSDAVLQGRINSGLKLRGVSLSDEHKNKIRIAMSDENVKAKMRKPTPQSVRNKISERNRGRPKSAEFIENLRGNTNAERYAEYYPMIDGAIINNPSFGCVKIYNTLGVVPFSLGLVRRRMAVVRQGWPH